MLHAEGMHLSRAEKNEIVQEITVSVANRLQQTLPAYPAGYSAGASAPIAMPDFGDSCMDFDVRGGASAGAREAEVHSGE